MLFCVDCENVVSGRGATAPRPTDASPPRPRGMGPSPPLFRPPLRLCPHLLPRPSERPVKREAAVGKETPVPRRSRRSCGAKNPNAKPVFITALHTECTSRRQCARTPAPVVVSFLWHGCEKGVHKIEHTHTQTGARLIAFTASLGPSRLHGGTSASRLITGKRVCVQRRVEACGYTPTSPRNRRTPGLCLDPLPGPLLHFSSISCRCVLPLLSPSWHCLCTRH